MKISVNRLMVLERILLEMNARMRFELRFGDAYKLYEYLKSVGRVTSYAFLLQDEFHKEFNDQERLKEYHKSVMESDVDFEYGKMTEFVDYVAETYGNEGFSNIVSQFKFWS